MDAPTITDAAGIMYDVDERRAKFYSPIVAVSYLPKSHARQREGLESGYAEQDQRVLVPSL